MTNFKKCRKFIKLQLEVNHDIDVKGETSFKKASRLDILGDSLNHLEIEWVIKTWGKVL